MTICEYFDEKVAQGENRTIRSKGTNSVLRRKLEILAVVRILGNKKSRSDIKIFYATKEEYSCGALFLCKVINL